MLQKRKEIPVLECDLLNALEPAKRYEHLTGSEHLTHSGNKRAGVETVRVQ